METIYWIQRLGALHTIALAIAILCIFAGITLLLFRDEKFDLHEDPDDIRKWWKCIRLTMYSFIFFSLLAIFTPSKKDLYVIYGVGGTIDYIKSNDTAKQLPDKVINALDAWIDEQNKNSIEQQ